MSLRPPPRGLTVLERGWLSSNNILLHAERADDAQDAVLVDSGHGRHAAQTLALVDHALAGRPLARLINTHLHSDHCGGNAALQQRQTLPVWTPPGQADRVNRWDEDALSYRATGQFCPRFAVQGELTPGSTLTLAGQAWDVIAAPGHDPDAVMLLRAADGALISADALWENGFGVVFPELDGRDAFDAVAQTLDLIERLPVQWVIPGHGSCFHDVKDALARARRRLGAHRAQPSRHARYAAKVLLKYHMMEEGRQAHAALQAWARHTPLMHSTHQRSAAHQGLRDFIDELLGELLDSGALRREDDLLIDA